MEDIGEKCAVFGVYGKGLDVSRLAFFGLYALQHRGQESSGMAVSDGEVLTLRKGMGLVPQVFAEEEIAKLKGHIVVAHNRYSTRGGSHVKHAQPMLVAGKSDLQHPTYDTGGMYAGVSLCSNPEDEAIALAHNGNLPSTKALEMFLDGSGIDHSGFSDSRMMAEAIGVHLRRGEELEEAIAQTYPLMTGAFSLLIMSKDKLVALRDSCGIRPLSIAKLNGGYVVASETCAFPPIGAEFIGDVAAGEMVVLDERGLTRVQLAPATPKFDIFEFVYFARPDSTLLGRSVYEVRKNYGIELVRESHIDADVVIPIPETAIPSAIGYSLESGIPMQMALTKNRYIHRTFIQPEQHVREQGVRAKLSPIVEEIRGKRVVVIDDSIVRGTTSKQIVKILFESGAREVHFLSSSPPVRYPDFYGIDTPHQDDLIAAVKSIPEICTYLGATSVQYLSLDGLLRATGVPVGDLCTACFTGEYPIDIGERSQEVRKVLAEVHPQELVAYI